MKDPDTDYTVDDMEYLDLRLIAAERDIEDIFERLIKLESKNIG